MAAPATTTRQTPAGIKLKDGFRTKIACALDPDISFWEKTVTPPGYDAGDKIPQSTMHNTRWRTYAPRQLVDVTDTTLTAAYDPAVYDQVLAILGVETSWTVHYSDLSKLDFFGFLQQFLPQEHSEGEQPEANLMIVATNFDPVNKVEQGPVLTSVAGT